MAQIAGDSDQSYVRHKTGCVPSLKGGIGKSTAAAQIAHNLALFGFKVLIVDLDSNGGITALTGADANGGNTVRHLVEGNARGIDCVQAPADWQPDDSRSFKDGGALVAGGLLHVVPSGPRISESLNIPGSEAELRLRNQLAPEEFGFDYDFILLDALGGDTPTLNMALHAAEHILFPLEPESLEFRGFSLMISKAIRFATPFTPMTKINAIGAIVPQYVKGRVIHRDVMQFAKIELAKTVPGALWIGPPVPTRVIVKEAALHQVPVSSMNAWTNTEKNRSRVMDVAAAYLSITIAVAGAVFGKDIADGIYAKVSDSDLPSQAKKLITDGLNETEELTEETIPEDTE